MDSNEIRLGMREALSNLGGNNPLTSFEASSFGQVDLSRAHPGGLAQLSSARNSVMTNLVRDGVAQARALSAAKRIKRKSDHLMSTFGIESCYIAGGLVEVASDSRKLPILLWRTRLIVKGDDFELRVDPEPILNPALYELIKERRFDFRETDLLAIATGQGDLIPISVLSLVSEILHGPDIEIEKLLVLGNFVPDLIKVKSLESEISDEDFLELLADKPQVESTDVLTLVANADLSQKRVIASALSGNSFVVETLPGCGYLQTLVNILAGLSIQGKRALVLAAREQTLDEVAERLTESGLAGVAVRNTDTWSDVVAAISRHEKAGPENIEEARGKAQKAESAATEYFDAVFAENNLLGVSLIQAMRELARLAALSTPPVNNARIRVDLLLEIRDLARPVLHDAHEAGLFRYGPRETPWFKAKFSSSGEISEALRAAKSLAGEEFRTLSYQINRYLQDQKLAPCSTVQDWAGQLRLLLGIRETLDKFLPSVYDRSLQDLILATAPRNERGSLSGAQRRRFKKLAKEYIRPGSSVPNLHAALVAAESQRENWFSLNSTQAPPTVPLGLKDVQEKFETITSTLEKLQRHLNPDPNIELLTRLSFEDLGQKLLDLSEKTEILDQLLERVPLQSQLDAIGLSDLADELCKLNPSEEQAYNEFELAWWQSALEAIVGADPRILEYGAERIAEIESEYESANEELISQGGAFVRTVLAERWKTAVGRLPAQADSLRNLLRKKELSLQSGFQEGAGLWEALVPAVLISPMRISELAKSEKFDVVLVLDAASTGIAEALASLTKAKQIIAFGDPVIAAPEGFDTIARANQGYVDSDRESVFGFFSSRLPVLEISRNYRSQGQVLGLYLNQNFYQNRILMEPSPDQYFGNHNFEHFEIKAGSHATSTIEGATESLDAEVQKVSELVINHARWTPEESLMVVTASRSHKDRVESAIEQGLQDQPQLSEFFASHGREKFEVTLMSELTHRIADRVIFSIGFGRTPEGRISGSLGDFNSDNAARWMVNQIVSARKRLTVVSCYNFEDLAAGKLPDNQVWLKDLIAPNFLSDVRHGEPDPLLADLAARLKKLGLSVSLNFAGSIPLVASIGNRASVVDADWSLFGDSWDEKLRLRPGFLRSMGWEYQRVHALEIFAQPQDVANRIAKKLGLDPEKKALPLFEEQAFDETSRAWGDPDDSNDDRLWDDKPPHWG
ncbi:MAG: hypothetical protein K9G13_02550 [Aquiluna sp.]|nr:hypothetical protein [Aquiluna sp.]MCF8545404.1 hypothetical protein [Aquiluna sp.]